MQSEMKDSKRTILVVLGFRNLFLVSMIKFLQLLQMLPSVSLQTRRKSRYRGFNCDFHMKYIFCFCSLSMLIQGTAPGVLSGIVKGFKGGKVIHNVDLSASAKSNFAHLEDIFLRSPFPDPSPTATDNQEVVELNIGSLSLSTSTLSFSSFTLPDCILLFGTDEIEIDDEPLPVASTSSRQVKNHKKGKSAISVFLYVRSIMN